MGPPASEREGTRNVALAVRLVAAELGNTPAICRRSYVHPMVIARYVDDAVTIERFAGRGASRASAGNGAHTAEEAALVRFLDEYFPERRRRPRTSPPSTRRDTIPA
jgi:DNA topoisomerase-1